jgi:hypothetical protein
MVAGMGRLINIRPWPKNQDRKLLRVGGDPQKEHHSLLTIILFSTHKTIMVDISSCI